MRWIIGPGGQIQKSHACRGNFCGPAGLSHAPTVLIGTGCSSFGFSHWRISSSGEMPDRLFEPAADRDLSTASLKMTSLRVAVVLARRLSGPNPRLRVGSAKGLGQAAILHCAWLQPQSDWP